MTYRGQLFIVLLTLVVVSTSLFAAASYLICNRLLQREVHRKVHSIAATGALMLHADSIAQIASAGTAAKPQYTQIEDQLKAIRDANRRQDVNVDHIFILIPSRDNPQQVVYGVDTGEESGLAHHAGDPFVANGQQAANLENLHRLDNQLDNFQFRYDVGLAPIYDRSGKLIAELGVKLGWAPDTMLGNVWKYLAPPFAVTVVIAIVTAIMLSRGVTVPLYSLRGTVDAIGKGNLEAAAEVRGTVEFKEMASAINLMTRGLRERKMIEQAFSGYLSREVLDQILRDGKVPELKGVRRRISVLFADIRNFTSMSEARRPEEVVEVLSEFFARMVPVVQKNGGYIDKFTGDGMMATFGAIVEDPGHETHAVASAIEMQRALHQLCAKWQGEGRSGFAMGIGVNSGNAVVGNIGTEAHMEFTAIGDTVNLASRLQTATKEFDAEILVSEETRAAAQSQFRWNSLGGIHVKGRVQRVQVYGVATDAS
ncbi:MAG TPA: adenylate/guanylate cyclase domain-containing protein [Candidatus Binataceae bacterium]|nr:adenylate/guanylate cyclase domain-containing protein [Candidatus Binataceae bacterium]